jgi:carbamoyl-phosphate synthase large subunit
VEGTVLFVGAGRHQRRAIERARELGLRVVAVDRNADGAGLAAADEREVVDFTDVEAVERVGREHEVDGVLTVSADRAVPVVAAVAEALGLPGIGVETAHAMTHKVAMRRLFAEHGVPQPRSRRVRNFGERHGALEVTGLAGRARSRPTRAASAASSGSTRSTISRLTCTRRSRSRARARRSSSRSTTVSS